MHTLQFGKTTFNFNSDLSGEVVIAVAGRPIFEAPGADLLAFVAEHVRRERISQLEDATAEELLGIKPPPSS